MSAPTRASTAGRAYLDLRKLARQNGRPVDELLQLHILESFLDRLTRSRFAERLVLKGGVLLPQPFRPEARVVPPPSAASSARCDRISQ